MPEAYLKGGDWRLFYTLRSFYIKRIDAFRNEAFKLMKSKKTFAKGFARMVWLATAFGLLGAAGDEVQDFLRNRKRSFRDHVYDNLLRLMMLSQYSFHTLSERGPTEAIAKELTPPAGIFEMVGRDVWNTVKGEDRGWELWRVVPVGGQFYYYWFGEGARREEERERRERERASKSIWESESIWEESESIWNERR